MKEIQDIDCIEASPVENIAYVAGTLASTNKGQTCPVLVIDFLKNQIKCKSLPQE